MKEDHGKSNQFIIRVGTIISINIKKMRLQVITFLVLFSCSNPPAEPPKNKNEQETNNKVTDETSRDDINECFMKILQRDTFVVVLKQKNNLITGKLSFDNYQKDGSSGPVHGKADDDIIKLWYNFESEGMKSVMEVWYKRKGNELLRGIGPTTVSGDSSYFSNPSAIEFSTEQSLEKTDCKNIPSKYK